jgi:flagellar basal-body rod modification protein FlgD
MSAVAGINTVASNYSSDSTQARTPQQVLGQDDFLKLLVTQMTSQDPLDPQKDTDFIAQMAQFSSLEQAKTMQNDMATLQANSLLGRTVMLSTDDNSYVGGVVSAVQIQAGTPQIVVNGQSYDLSQLAGIAPTPTDSTNTTNP